MPVTVDGVTPREFRVLVLCTGNSARSQIGEALFATRGALRPVARVVAASAGSHPASRVNPYALEVLAAHGIRWGDRAPQRIDALLGQMFDLVITVCDHARDVCPIFPGGRAHVHWGLPDPADAATPETARAAFQETYRALSARVDALLAEPIESMTAAACEACAAHIHASLARPNV